MFINSIFDFAYRFVFASTYLNSQNILFLKQHIFKIILRYFSSTKLTFLFKLIKMSPFEKACTVFPSNKLIRNMNEKHLLRMFKGYFSLVDDFY